MRHAKRQQTGHHNDSGSCHRGETRRFLEKHISPQRGPQDTGVLKWGDLIGLSQTVGTGEKHHAGGGHDTRGANE